MQWIKATELPEQLPEVVVIMFPSGRMFAYNIKHSLKGLQEVLKHHPEMLCLLVQKPDESPKTEQGIEAVEVLDWLLKQSDEDEIVMVDGNFYYSEDEEGNKPMDGKDIYNLYKTV